MSKGKKILIVVGVIIAIVVVVFLYIFFKNKKQNEVLAEIAKKRNADTFSKPWSGRPTTQDGWDRLAAGIKMAGGGQPGEVSGVGQDYYNANVEAVLGFLKGFNISTDYAYLYQAQIRQYVNEVNEQEPVVSVGQFLNAN
jgi:hypothetical protein